jgi:hypothetical protein
MVISKIIQACRWLKGMFSFHSDEELVQVGDDYHVSFHSVPSSEFRRRHKLVQTRHGARYQSFEEWESDWRKFFDEMDEV